MILVYRKGDLVRLKVPTMSGWQGVGVVLEPVHRNDVLGMVFFRKQEEHDDAIPSVALLSEVEPLEPATSAMDDALPLPEVGK